MADYNYYDYYNLDLNTSSLCPKWAPVLGFTGIVAAVVLASEFMAVELDSAQIFRGRSSIRFLRN